MIAQLLKPVEYSLNTYHRSNQDTCLINRPIVTEGDWVESGDILADCAASQGGDLALGQNVLVAYMPWEGYNYEDAILISERLVYDDLFTSIHIEKYEVELRESKFGKEKFTRNIPDETSVDLKKLDKNGIIKIGSWVQEGEILVGKITPLNVKQQSPYQKLLYSILMRTPGEATQGGNNFQFRDSSLRAPKGIKAKVIEVKIFGDLKSFSASKVRRAKPSPQGILKNYSFLSLKRGIRSIRELKLTCFHSLERKASILESKDKQLSNRFKTSPVSSSGRYGYVCGSADSMDLCSDGLILATPQEPNQKDLTKPVKPKESIAVLDLKPGLMLSLTPAPVNMVKSVVLSSSPRSVFRIRNLVKLIRVIPKGGFLKLVSFGFPQSNFRKQKALNFSDIWRSYSGNSVYKGSVGPLDPVYSFLGNKPSLPAFKVWNKNFSELKTNEKKRKCKVSKNDSLTINLSPSALCFVSSPSPLRSSVAYGHTKPVKPSLLASLPLCQALGPSLWKETLDPEESGEASNLIPRISGLCSSSPFGLRRVFNQGSKGIMGESLPTSSGVKLKPNPPVRGMSSRRVNALASCLSSPAYVDPTGRLGSSGEHKPIQDPKGLGWFGLGPSLSMTQKSLKRAPYLILTQRQARLQVQSTKLCPTGKDPEGQQSTKPCLPEGQPVVRSRWDQPEDQLPNQSPSKRVKSYKLKRSFSGEIKGPIWIYLADKRRLQVGDKIAGRHGNKGIVSQIFPRQDMPYILDGTPIDIVLNPLGVPSRMNVGQIYECLLGLAGKHLGENFKIQPFDEVFGAEASRSLTFSKLYEARKKTGKQWLFDSTSPGKMRIFDGRSGDCFDQAITVGYAYILKLVHMADDKIHARSTGPYSLVTQQPLRGRSKQGGQRVGEMEVWALEGYGAAFTLLEMLTIKSDDMTGRMSLWSKLCLNKEISIGTPESFKVLICELQAICLDIGLFANVFDSLPRKGYGSV
uniref:DNA-directed RNA polymerase n=1 Tax=Staurocarteria crucifera TaxID=47781 RepID=A0A0S2ICC2_9CHLO|nr:beta subunit of RNA polymerase [Carteria crucifera]